VFCVLQKAIDIDPMDVLTFHIVDSQFSRLFAIDSRNGTVWTTQSVDVGEYQLNVSVSDGRHVRYAGVRLTIEGIGSMAADSAVVVQIEKVAPSVFLSSHLRRFVLALKGELAVRERDVKVCAACV